MRLWILNQIYNDTLNRRTWMVSSAKDFRLLWSPRIAFVISSQGVRILTNSNVVVLPWKASSPDNIMASYKKALMETFVELVLRHGIVGFLFLFFVRFVS